MCIRDRGKKFTAKFHGHLADVICLPHPSGVSRWPRTPEGMKLLGISLKLIEEHPAWVAQISQTNEKTIQ